MKCTIASFCFSLVLQLPSPVTCSAVGRLGLYQQLRLEGLSGGCVCIPGAKQGMLELIPQTLFFLECARINTEGGSGYPRLDVTDVTRYEVKIISHPI